MGIKFCLHDRLKNACIDCLRDELETERKLHELAKAFHDLAILERNRAERELAALKGS